jgi:hypothetical protein
MSFPKKGKSFPRGDGSGSGGNGGGSGGGLDFAIEIASALERTMRDKNVRIKTVSRWTGANERTVKNWLSGQYGPCGAHLVVLLQHSDEVLNSVLAMADRHESLIAQKMADIELRVRELSSLIRELNSQT